MPITNGGGGDSYIDVVPLSSSGTWGNGVIHYVGAYRLRHGLRDVDQAGNIVAADLNGAGKPSIALVNSGTGEIEILLADPASNQFLPVEDIDASSSDSAIGMLAVAPFMGTAATVVYRGPTSDPSTLVQNERRLLDQDLSRRHRHPVQLVGPGDLGIRPQRQHVYLRLRHQRRGRRRARHDHRPGRARSPPWPTTVGPYQHDHRPGRSRHDLHGRRPRQPDRDRRPRRRDHRRTAIRRPRTTRPPAKPTPTAIRRRPHYNSFGQLTSETLFDGTSTTSIDPAQSNGLLAPGGSGSLSTDLRRERHRPRRPHHDADLQLDEPPDRRGEANGGIDDDHLQQPGLSRHRDRRRWAGRSPTRITRPATSPRSPSRTLHPIPVRGWDRPPRRSPTTIVRRADLDHRLQRQHHDLRARLARQRAGRRAARRRGPGVDLQLRAARS